MNQQLERFLKLLNFKNETIIKKIVITTNGYHLDQKAKLLVDCGLDGINISIDSLGRQVFKNITKRQVT